MKKTLVFALTILLGATSAFAQTPNKGSKGGDKAVDWEEFKDRCANPMNYQEQVRPMNIIIQCTSKTTSWMSDAPGTVMLPSDRIVTSAVFSHKFYVGAKQEAVATEQGAGSCSRFKEVEAVITQEYAPTCDQILSNVKGSLTDFCASAVGKGGKDDPKTDIRDTGRVINTCGSVDDGKGGGKGGKG